MMAADPGDEMGGLTRGEGVSGFRNHKGSRSLTEPHVMFESASEKASESGDERHSKRSIMSRRNTTKRCLQCRKMLTSTGNICYDCRRLSIGGDHHEDHHDGHDNDRPKGTVHSGTSKGYVGSYTLLVNFIEECRENDWIGDSYKERLLNAMQDLNSGGRGGSVNVNQALFQSSAASNNDQNLAHLLPSLGIKLKEAPAPTNPELNATRCPCGATSFMNGITFCVMCGTDEAYMLAETSTVLETIFPQDNCAQTAAMREFEFDVLKVGWNIREDAVALMRCFKQPFDIQMRHHIKKSSLNAWIENIAEQYLKNPYHSWRHAFDVMQFCYVQMTMGQAGMYFLFRDMLALFIAQLSHDVAHPGLSNNFLINNAHDIALMYNDISPLENMHAHTCFLTMRKEGCNILEPLSSDAFTHVRSRVIDAILATDMKEHYQLVEKLQEATTREEMLAHDEKEDRRLLLKVFTHMADLGHNSRPWRYHKYITVGLEEENFRQGDQERDMGRPITPLMDRNKDSMGGVQKFFMEVMIMPLLAPFQKLLVDEVFDVAKNGLLGNAKKWQSLVDVHGKVRCDQLVELDNAENQDQDQNQNQ